VADSNLRDAGEHAKDQWPERTLAKMPEEDEYLPVLAEEEFEA
jgi:hypothetical protein